MQFSGDYRFAQPAHQIWAALNDPLVLRRTIPDCDAIDRVSETEFTGVVKLVIGPMKFRFSGHITLSDLDPPWRYTITCSGVGGMAGLAKGVARVTMSPDLSNPLGQGTIMRYHAEVALSGMIATLAEKLLQGTAVRLADDFFARFAAQIPQEPAIAMAKQAPTPEIPAQRAEVAYSETVGVALPQAGLHPIVWSVGLSVLVGIILACSVR